MKQSTYLYGRKFNAIELSTLPYAKALAYKVECAKTLVGSLTEATTMTTNWHRINQVYKAISFNEALLAEANGKDFDI